MARQTRLEMLLELKRCASLEDGSFSHLGIRDDGVEPLPECEDHVNRFILARTKLYRDSWVTPKIDRLIAEEKRRRERKKRNKDGQ